MINTYFAAEQVYKVEVVNPHTFADWLVFLLGGALGAIIVLGLERILDRYQEERKKKRIESAMKKELQDNLHLSNKIIANITNDDKALFVYENFDTVWVELFLQYCINYRNSDSIQLQSQLLKIKGLITQIHTIMNMLMQLHATGKALNNFTVHIQNYNKNLLAITKELHDSIEITQNSH